MRPLIAAVFLMLLGANNRQIGIPELLGSSLWIAGFFLFGYAVISLARKGAKSVFGLFAQTDDESKRIDAPKDTALSDSEQKTSLHSSRELRPSKSTEINEDAMNLDRLVPRHHLLVLSVNSSISERSDIYEAVRFAWKLNPDRAQACDYVLAHKQGRVIGVFKAHEWVSADSTEFNGLFEGDTAGRWGFVGEVAPSEVLLQYFNKHLPEGFIKRGASNPVRFLAPEGSDLEPMTNGQYSPVKDFSISLIDTNCSVDSDGDFHAVSELVTDNLGEQGDLICVRASYEATVSGVCTGSEVGEFGLEVGQRLALESPYLSVDGAIPDIAQVNANLDVFKPGAITSNSFRISDLPAKLHSGPVCLEIKAAEVDEDGDLRAEYTYYANDPILVGIEIGKSSEDELVRSYVTATEEETMRSTYLMGFSEDDKICVSIIQTEEVVLGLTAQAQALVQSGDEDGISTDEIDLPLNFQFSTDEDEASVDEANSTELYLRGGGGRFEFYQLARSEIDELIEEYKANPEEFLDQHLSGTEEFSRPIFSGAFGNNLFDLEIQNKSTGENIEISDVAIEEVQLITDSELVDPTLVDYIYETSGKVFATVQVKNVPPENFDSELLQLRYIRYELEGYAEKYGTIIIGITYDGEELVYDPEDNGQEISRCMYGYILDDHGELDDYAVVHDSEIDSEKFDWDAAFAPSET